MDEEVLINRTGTIRETDTSDKCVRPGCLGVIKGVIADYSNPTRNNRFYSRELWVKVFDTPWVKEALETKTLFGEADHPEERIEPLLTKAAVVLVSYEFRDDEKCIYGTFDILDTPSGRILRTLADYGCELGVSSRGRGQVVSRNGRQEVDPDSYVFGGFDVVALPAVKKARQTFMKESGTKDFRLDIVEQIELCESEADLRTIKSILDSANISDIAKVDRLIESRMSEFHGSEDVTIIDGLTRDLNDAISRINDLQEKVDEQRAREGSATIANSPVLDAVRAILERAGVKTDTIADDQVLDALECAIGSRGSEDGQRKVRRSKGMERELSEYKRLVSAMSDEAESRQREIESITSVANRLREALGEAKTARSEYDARLRESMAENESLRTELGSVIAEYDEVMGECESLAAKNRELVERYLNEQAIRLNIPRNSLVRLLPEEYDVSDIDDVVDDQMNIRRKISRLPISGGLAYDVPLTENVLTRTSRGSEDDSHRLENTRKILQSMKKDRYNEKSANDVA